jgi:glycerophosphoryl diester phosphodiesterase
MKSKKLIIIILALILPTVILVGVIGGGFGDNHSPKLFEENSTTFIAHRGLYNYYAENSYEGYRNCERMGFKAIETDIRVTKDRQLIVFHDDSTSRLLGVNSKIEELEMQDLKDRFLRFHGTATENKVMTLDDLLMNFQNSFIIYLDNKVNKRWVADSLLKHIELNQAGEKVILASSNLLFLSYVKYKNNSIHTALEGFDSGKEWIYSIIPKKFKPDYFSSFMSKVDKEHIEFLKENDLLDRKIVYGVDSTNVHSVIESGIKSMIIDFDSSFTDILHMSLEN